MSRARTLVLTAFAVLALAIVVPPFVNINRFRRGIVRSIGAGLNRPVYADAVELTLFPRPAFVLHHLTVADWPAYGAEPVIMADTVTASLRASTLWHRRVEIASLRFNAPSVNLARNGSGQWNIESLIGNSSAMQRTAASSSATPPPFPYVEATDARINFKRGPEKLPFSLEGADLAFWKESGNEWHVRIKARPVRTDLPPGDSGQILGQASVKTLGVLMSAPIQASFEWRRGQLGEISRLLHGEDSGWRGAVDWTANVQGTLAKAQVTTDIQVEEFRRAEFIPSSEIDLAAHCQAEYVHADRRLDSLDCNAPLGGGHLLVKSNVGNTVTFGNGKDSARAEQPQPADSPSVQLILQHVSAGFFLELLRHVHPGVAADASATGEVNGRVHCEWGGFDTLHACSGELRSTPLALSLPHVEHSLHLSPLVISRPVAIAVSGRVAGVYPSQRRAKRSDQGASNVSPPAGWNLAPSRVSLAGAMTAIVAGRFTSSGLTLNIDGSADLTQLTRIAHALDSTLISSGIQSLRGPTMMALSLRSNWLPQPNPEVLVESGTANQANLATQAVPWFAPSQWSGTLQIHNATLQLGSFPGTFQIGAAQVVLSPTGVEWTGVTGTYAHMPFDGSIGWQTSCMTSHTLCARTFALHVVNMDVDRFQAALRHSTAGSGLLEKLNPWARGVSDMPEISGTFDADVLSAGKLSVKKASLQLHIEGHRAELVSISGVLFGGMLSGIPGKGSPPVFSGNAAGPSGQPGGSGHEDAMNSGAGSAEWGNGAPIYTLRAALGNLQPDLVAAIWHEKWGKGTATAEIRLHTRGWSTAEVAQNASGSFAIDWRNGTLAASLPALARSNATARLVGSEASTNGVTRFVRLHAVGSIRDRKLVLDSGQLVLLNMDHRTRASTSGEQSISGTVTFSRHLDLRLQPSEVSITGPIDAPIMKARSAKIPRRAGSAGQ